MYLKKKYKHLKAKLLLKQLNDLALHYHSCENEKAVLQINSKDLELLKSVCIFSEENPNIYGIPIKLKAEGKPSLNIAEIHDETENSPRLVFDAS